jgi:hypothetical protein
MFFVCAAGVLLESYAWANLAPIPLDVNATGDTVDINPSDGLCLTIDGTCTLRAAVMTANHYTVPVQINLPAGVYTLGKPSGSDGDDTGDLNIVSVFNSPSVYIVGAGAANTIIDGNMTDGLFTIENERSVSMSGVTLRNGKASSYGGAIYNFGTLALTDVTILTNSAVDLGGGLNNNGTAFVTRVAFNGNGASYGGGIFNSGELTITASTFDSNTADFGAGLASYTGAVANLSHVTFNANKAMSWGGGIFNGGVQLTVADSTFSGNEAVIKGGGFFNTSGSPLEIDRSTIMGGKAQQGAGIYNSGGMTVLNTTISQNTSTTFGGGISNNGAVGVYSSTIAYNTAGFGTGSGYGGGASNSPGSTFNVSNTIVALNYSPDTGFYDDCNGTFNSYGMNRFFAGTYCVITQFGAGTHSGPVSLLELGTLKDNGGPTLTIALKYFAFTDLIDVVVSGCLDQNGFALSTDQRGRPRIVGADCDIGAFEYDPGDIFTSGFQ